MRLSTIRELSAGPNEFAAVELRGWTRSLRDMKNFGFIELNDGSSFGNAQIVFDASLANYSEVSALNIGSAVIVRGSVVLTPGGKQPYEVKASEIIVEGKSRSDYPLQKKRHTAEYLRTIAHLRPRTNLFGAAFRIRSAASFALHSFFNERGFVMLHAPIITKSDAEGAGQMFRVTAENFDGEFFGGKSSLTVSGQLEAETFAMAFGKTYTFGPTFRAEDSNTPRHAAEFWMLEPEIAFADIGDNMKLAEDTLKHVISYILRECRSELTFLNNFVDKGLIDRLTGVVGSDFGVCEYGDAIGILKNSGVVFRYPVEWGADLQTEHERYLTEEHFKRPVFIINYPKEIKAFYMRLNDDGRTVAAMDLLVPGIGEIIGGSQREERLDVLEARMTEMHMDKEAYRWYLDLRRYGGTRHAGFGLGFERLLMYLTGIGNIRDVLPYPRVVGSAEF
ncbi:MAG: asparagine--tRNA ligase [Oscillospiraceae bacterium]|jgi:asparaginyl-tRNA synthetase|nr:asparagine--tRNA ligase [Oscillospiraceae bacterium]MDR2360322.1 asparagine--tRNA ligase [Oscillospiraceae bacterium]